MVLSPKKNKKIKLSIVVPCFNEEANVLLVLKKFKKAIRNLPIEVIMVDNGSADKTGELIRKNLTNFPFAKMVSIKRNIGYGNGILQGLKSGVGEYLGFTHADLQTDPSDITRAFRLIPWGQDDVFIKGRRQGRKPFDRLFSFFMAFYISLALRGAYSEINAQPTIFPRSLFKSFKNPPKDFSLDLYIYFWAKAKKLKIKRLNVQFPDRKFGQSSWNTSFKSRIKLSKRAISYTKELKKRLHDLRCA